MLNAHLQKRKGGWRVVVVSPKNGKLVLAGETIRRALDAEKVWKDLGEGTLLCESLPINHKFPKNSGPKKKK